jgi:hypothetical protein
MFEYKIWLAVYSKVGAEARLPEPHLKVLFRSRNIDYGMLDMNKESIQFIAVISSMSETDADMDLQTQ